MNAIEIQGLRKSYGKTEALKGIDLVIPKGSFFALLGPNGAGKSTLINILAGLVRPGAGSAAVLGADVIQSYRAARFNIGVVPQEIVQDVFFSVRELLKIQAGLYGQGREANAWIEELLDILGLQKKADQNLRALSGGMKRRAMIAQAMVHKPQVLVLDEPTAGVDVELRETLWKFIKRLHGLGHTVVLTTHYLEEAESLCEDVAIINQGRLIEQGKTHDLINKYQSRIFHFSVEGEESRLPPSFKKAECQKQAEHLSISLDAKQDSLDDMIVELKKSGFIIRDLRIEEPKLEDVFRRLTA